MLKPENVKAQNVEIQNVKVQNVEDLKCQNPKRCEVQNVKAQYVEVLNVFVSMYTYYLVTSHLHAYIGR
jgi:hypothetical protein